MHRSFDLVLAILHLREYIRIYHFYLVGLFLWKVHGIIQFVYICFLDLFQILLEFELKN